MQRRTPPNAALSLALAGLLAAPAFGCPGTEEHLDEPRVDADVPPPDAPEPVPLRVADFNAHDFFDDHADAVEQVLTAAEYQAKLAAVGAVLLSLAADVVVLQEIESQRVLDDLAAGPLASLGYGARVLAPTNDPRGIHVAALSRVAFDKVVSHANDYFTLAGTTTPQHKYARDCLELHLSYGGRQVVLLGVHFRSKVVPDDPDKRLAEAQHTRAVADALTTASPSLAVLVLGDFNDTPGSPPVLAVVGAAPSLFADSAEKVAPLADAWTYTYSGQHQLIDHQMASPGLALLLDPAAVAIPHGADVGKASDHAPVLATYRIR